MWHLQSDRNKWTGLILVLALVAGPAVPAAWAADPDQLDCSLKMVPADVAFYSTMLRNKEQIDALVHSKAWAKIRDLPLVQTAWKKGLEELHQGPLAAAGQFWQQPENRQLLEMLGDMGSQEVFFCGGSSSVDFLKLAMQLNSPSQTIRSFAAGMKWGMAGRQADPGKMQVLAILQLLNQNRDLIKVPDLVIGFKLDHPDRAEAQLQRLENLLKGLVEQAPPLKGRIQSKKEGKNSVLILTLDGSMVPWDEIPYKDLEDKPGEYDALVKKLQGLKLTIHLGVRDRYLLLSLGESTGILDKLGKGKSLATQPEFKPLERFSGQKLTSIGYASKAMMQALTMNKKDVDQMAKELKDALAKFEFPENLKERLHKDLEELAKDLKATLGEAGAALSFSFLTSQGQEAYTYDWSDHAGVDGSKPLTLLNHLGGSPLFAAVGRAKYSPRNYQLLVKWIKLAYSYYEDFGLPLADPNDRGRAEELIKALMPSFRRLDEVTGKMFLPSLADGQTAFVLDGKLTSKQWVNTFPELDKPVPILELALVFGVSDAELLQKACGEYRATLNHMIEKIRDQVPFLPPFEIPPAETRKLKNGVAYFYELPAILGLDPQLVPNAAVSDKVAALSISTAHSERLLVKTPLKVDGGPLADQKRPLAGAAYCNWPGVVDALTPWVELGIRQYFTVQGDGGDKADDKGTDDILKQAKTVFEVLKLLRNFSSATYVEEGVLVTHSVMVVKDL